MRSQRSTRRARRLLSKASEAGQDAGAELGLAKSGEALGERQVGDLLVAWAHA